MASVFRREGQRKWYYKYKDENGKWVTRVGSANKADTLAIAQAKESAALKIANGLAPPAINIQTLNQSLRDFERHLFGKRNTSKYVTQTINRLRRIFESVDVTCVADFKQRRFFGDVSAFLSGMGDQTANHYKAVLKAFLNWGNYLPPGDIRKGLTLHKVEDAARRRALTQKEVTKLLADTELSPVVREGLTGRERAMLYRVALGTGFRAQELASLRPSSFHLKDFSVYLPAGEAKNSEEVYQPLHPDLVKRLAKWLPSDKDDLLWPGQWYTKAGQMLSGNQHLKPQKRTRRTQHGGDLEVAGIPRETPDGVVDFHSLRVTFITELARAGVNPAIAQQLARHSDIRLTMQTYTRFAPPEVAAAVPNFGA